MKVLIVSNTKIGEGRTSHFVNEQMNALREEGVEIIVFGITGKGAIGYLKSAWDLRKIIKKEKPDLIHAHYGLSGLCANLQRHIPVITTYHGSDIHSGGWILKLSQCSMKLSAYNIFVTDRLLQLSQYHGNNKCIQSCGLDLDTITVISRSDARKELGWNESDIKILFSASFQDKNKNSDLAKEAVSKIDGAELIELDGYTRHEVNLLINACNLQLTTSKRESGPLIVKEAMACGTPVVSVDVGDVKFVMGRTSGCYIGERDAEDLAEKIKKALAFEGKTNGRQRIIELGLDNHLIAKRIVSLYKEVLKNNK